MPLKKGSSKETISDNIKTELHDYKETGKIGNSTPKSKESARKQAIAIAYSTAGKSRKKKKMKKFLEALKTKENSALIETIEKGLMICLENMASHMSLEDATRIASQWHHGDGSELYLFASTGKIHDKQALSEEIEGTLNALIVADIDDMDKEAQEGELLDLKDFVDSNGGSQETQPPSHNGLMEAAIYLYNGKPVRVLKNKGMDDEYSTEIWTIETKDGQTMDVKSRDLKMTQAPELPSNKLFDASSAQRVVDTMKSKVTVPFFTAKVSTLGGDENVSILFAFSLQPKEQWTNNIFENSQYARFSLDNNGVLEQFTLSKLPKKFRKTLVRNVDDLVNKLNAYIKEVSTPKPPQPETRGNV